MTEPTERLSNERLEDINGLCDTLEAFFIIAAKTSDPSRARMGMEKFFKYVAINDIRALIAEVRERRAVDSKREVLDEDHPGRLRG